MVPLRLTYPIDAQEQLRENVEFSDGALALLNHLRMVALDCRAKPRTDLFEACALLSGDRMVARSAHADALMRCLRAALGKKPILHRPGEAEISFDEAWLMRLALSIAADNTDSANFLLASRVAPQDRRNLRFLLASIAECFALN